MELKIHYAGVFHQAEHYIQRPNHLFLFFHVSGLKRISFGKHELSLPQPFCRLFFPEEVFEFEFSSRRENWVIQFSSANFAEAGADHFKLETEQESVVLPKLIEVGSVGASSLKTRMSEIYATVHDPTSHNRILSSIYLMDIFKYYLEASSRNKQPSPAAELKRRIDELSGMLPSVSSLSRKCGYSADHLRVLFKHEYGVAPQEYRIRRIMARAMEMIAGSTRAVSDIAEDCGFKYLSHFSTLFRRIHGISPSEAIRRFRYR